MGAKCSRFYSSGLEGLGQGKKKSDKESGGTTNSDESGTSNEKESDKESDGSTSSDESSSSNDERSDEESSSDSYSSDVRNLKLKKLISHSSARKPQIPEFVIKLCDAIVETGLSDPGLYTQGPIIIDTMTTTHVGGTWLDWEDARQDIIKDREIVVHREEWIPKSIHKLTNRLAKTRTKVLRARRLKYDNDTLCLMLKDFLEQLREPLIPKHITMTFINNARNENKKIRSKKLCEAVEKLPKPNRDTLAHLILHFQLVEFAREKTEQERWARTIEGYGTTNLAWVLGSYVFRIGRKDDAGLALQKLMDIDPKYWKQFTKSYSKKKVWRPE